MSKAEKYYEEGNPMTESEESPCWWAEESEMDFFCYNIKIADPYNNGILLFDDGSAIIIDENEEPVRIWNGEETINL